MSLKSKFKSKKRTYQTFFEIKLNKKKEGTRKAYRLALKDFDKFCKKDMTNSLEALIPEFRKASTDVMIDTLQAWINQNELQSNLNQRGRLLQINSYLYYRGVKIDPRDLKDLEFEDSVSEERVELTDNELRTIIDGANPILKALIFTLSSSGMRVGECCHLVKSDFDLSFSRIAIKIKPKYTKKNSCGRTVFVSKEAEKYLKPILQKLNDNDLVFDTSPTIAHTIINLTVQFRRLIDRIGMDSKYDSGTRQKTLHALRAYFFTKAVQKHGLGYAHKMCGHRGYMEEYNRYSLEKKLEMYLELEPQLFVYEKKPDSEIIKDMKRDYKTVLSILKNSKSYAVYDDNDAYTELRIKPLDHIQLEKLLE